MSNEMIIFASRLDGNSLNAIQLPRKLNQFTHMSVISASIPKSFYNSNVGNQITINGTTYLVTAGIYDVYTFMTYLNNLAAINITFSMSTLFYSFNGAIISTVNHEIGHMLGIAWDGVSYSAPTTTVNFQPYSVLSILSPQADNAYKVVQQIFTENTTYGGVIYYAPQSDLLLNTIELVDLDSNIIQIGLYDHTGALVNLNNQPYNLILKFLKL